MSPQLVEIEELAEEEITRRCESAEQMLGEDDDLILRGRGHHFISWSLRFDTRWKKARQPVRLQLLRCDCGSTPIGGNRSLRRCRCGGGSGLDGDVDDPAGLGGLGLGGGLGALGSHGVRAERVGSAARGKEMSVREKRNLGRKGQVRFWSLPFAIYKGVRNPRKLQW